MKKIILLSSIFCMTLTLWGQNSLQTMADLNYEIPTQILKLDNSISVAYTDQGKGSETLLFIHGLASYIPAWKKNLSSLQNSYRCIAIDLPGYGKSSKGNYAVSMDFFADVVAEVCKKLSVDKVVLVGHSMGGQIAITTALKHPKLVSKLILIAPAGFETFNKGQKQWFRDVMTVDGVRLTTVEQIRINYAYNFYNMPSDAEFMINDRIAIRKAADFNDYCYHITKGVNAMVDQPVFDFLPSIEQPVLCVYGAKDNLIPNRFLNGGRTSKFMKKGAKRIRNCSLKEVENAGHFVMFEQSDEVNILIKEFLK